GGRRMQSLLEAVLEGARTRIEAADTIANEYVYAKDVGRAVDLAAHVAMPRQSVFNIGNGYVSSAEDVLAALEAVRPGARAAIEPVSAEQPKLAALDISAAKGDLGWEPRFTLSSAFADYLDELAASRRSP